MERYIMSRGERKQIGYHWLNIANDGQESQEEPPISEFTSLIQSEILSVVLARSKGQLILLVTDLNTKSRIDYHPRHIRNSVAWVGDNSDEATLRVLAVQSLKGLLTEKIDSVVTSGKDGSFQVDHKKLKELEILASRENVGNSPADLKRKIGKISEKLKNELADELKRQCLPSTDGPLVVVTEIKARKTLENAKVWRGLSTLEVNKIEQFPEEWEEIDRGGSIVLYNPDNPRAEEVKNIWDVPKNFLNNLDLKKWFGLSLIIIVVGLPIASWRLEFSQVASNPTPTSISFPTATPNTRLEFSQVASNPTPTSISSVPPATLNPQSSSTSSSTPSPTASPLKSQPSSQSKIICTSSISEDKQGIDLKVRTSNLKEKTMYVQMLRFVENNPVFYQTEPKTIDGREWIDNFKDLDGEGKPVVNKKYYILGSVEEIDTTVVQEKAEKFKDACLAEQSADGDSCFVCITTLK
ncbi:hypothetical protein [Kamptonema sp. UHCC 0994]|uniref:hypothetical protein n=1 Tax=Kamptonema sp. UHCC 0994 TaxID=3031329 RepID=UPI0023BA9BFB|nr:hypothetical protein [Kamptonema sp. UHCC 0994]MDF0556190.1 hypothetical protein [Kamptonema sp. UHCC 0994]